MLIRPEHASSPRYVRGRRTAEDRMQSSEKTCQRIEKQRARRKRKNAFKIVRAVNKKIKQAIFPNWVNFHRNRARAQLAKRAIPRLAFYCRMLALEGLIGQEAAPETRKSVSLGARQVSDLWESLQDTGLRNERIRKELSKQYRFLRRIYIKDFNELNR
jgi:intergrase/recombinase